MKKRRTGSMYGNPVTHVHAGLRSLRWIFNRVFFTAKDAKAVLRRPVVSGQKNRREPYFG
jgi:hypothetical protein